MMMMKPYTWAQAALIATPQESLEQFVSAAALQILLVNMDCLLLHAPGIPFPGIRAVRRQPAETFVNDLDVDALCTRIRRKMPSLKAVSVRLQGLRGREDVVVVQGELLP